MRSRVAWVVAEVLSNARAPIGQSMSNSPRPAQALPTQIAAPSLAERCTSIISNCSPPRPRISSQGRHRRTSNVLRLQRRIAQQTQSEHPTTRPPLTLGSTRQRSHGMIPHTSLENRRFTASQSTTCLPGDSLALHPFPPLPRRARACLASPWKCLVALLRSARALFVRQDASLRFRRARIRLRRSQHAWYAGNPGPARRTLDASPTSARLIHVHSYRLFDTRSGMSLLAKLDPTARLSRSACQ